MVLYDALLLPDLRGCDLCFLTLLYLLSLLHEFMIIGQSWLGHWISSRDGLLPSSILLVWISIPIFRDWDLKLWRHQIEILLRLCRSQSIALGLLPYFIVSRWRPFGDFIWLLPQIFISVSILLRCLTSIISHEINFLLYTPFVTLVFDWTSWRFGIRRLVWVWLIWGLIGRLIRAHLQWELPWRLDQLRLLDGHLIFFGSFDLAWT